MAHAVELPEKDLEPYKAFAGEDAKPGDNLSFVAVKQIAAAMNLTAEQLIAAVR